MVSTGKQKMKLEKVTHSKQTFKNFLLELKTIWVRFPKPFDLGTRCGI